MLAGKYKGQNLFRLILNESSALHRYSIPRLSADRRNKQWCSGRGLAGPGKLVQPVCAGAAKHQNLVNGIRQRRPRSWLHRRCRIAQRRTGSRNEADTVEQQSEDG